MTDGMGTYNLNKMQKKLKKYVNGMRYQHTLGVMYTAASLAMSCGEDLERAQVAGLLHDCAKCIPNAKKLKLCRQYGIPVSDVEKKAPYLLHAGLGAYLAKEKYHVEDEAILDAIRYHTTGRADMTLLEKIIFVADYIEPMRTKAPNLTEVRRLAFADLDQAVFVILRDTLNYLETENAFLDEQTEVAYTYYKQITEQREG